MQAQSAEERMRAAYDRIAAGFAIRNAGMPAAFRDVFGPRFLELARRASGEAVPSVLDVGCGGGRDAAWLAAGGAAVTGVDLSAGMLAQARSRAGQTGASPPRLLQMDMRRLAFGDGCFTGAWCSASLLHLPKRDAPAALGEMRRVLVGGGVLLLALQHGETEGWEPLDAAVYGESVERFFARYRAGEAESLLARSGFAVDLRQHSAGGGRTWLRFLAVASR
jgi:ubiquinone/menaquinone biosynthesis C-methylase UbiE